MTPSENLPYSHHHPSSPPQQPQSDSFSRSHQPHPRPYDQHPHEQQQDAHSTTLPQTPPPSTTSDPPQSSWATVIATFGLPCIIGVAAIDPGNLEVDLQAGATASYALIWALLIASILGCILQTLSAHVTICTGYHLAELCRRVYTGKPLLSHSVFGITILSVIAFDVAEVVGTAFAVQMLLGLPLWLGMVLSAADTLLVLFLQRTGLTRVELIVEGLLFILAACIVYEFVLSTPSFSEIARGALVPSFGPNPRQGVILAVSIMGSVIMSHNLFLHSWLEKQRHLALRRANTSVFSVAAGRTPVSQLLRRCRYAGIEAAAIFLATFLINTCLLVVAATLPRSAVSAVGELGLKQAGSLLERVLGQRFAATAWAIALLASGHAATVTGTLASQAVCEGFLDLRDGNSSSVVVVMSRTVAIIPAVVAALVAGERGSDGLAVASQTILSFALPFAAIPLFKVLGTLTSGRATGGFAYGRGLLGAGYVVFSVLMAANAYAVWEVGRTIAVSFGNVAFVGFMMVLGFILVIMLKLMVTPMSVEDFATVADQVGLPTDEEERMLPNKRERYDG